MWAVCVVRLVLFESLFEGFSFVFFGVRDCLSVMREIFCFVLLFVCVV